MDEKWTNTSSPSSRPMKPKPLVALNHLTVPTKRSSDIFFLLQNSFHVFPEIRRSTTCGRKIITVRTACQGKTGRRFVLRTSDHSTREVQTTPDHGHM